MTDLPSLPPAYAWLRTLNPLPLMLFHGLALHGVAEAEGTRDNPRIFAWAAELGPEMAAAYRSDSIPWCGLFLALVAHRAGKPVPAGALWALNWARFGVAPDRPALGDTLVFRRAGGGHVGLYVGEDSDAFHVLGGNQSDRVCFARIARRRLFAVRRPDYRNRPPTVRGYALAASGMLSNNEA